MMPAPATAPTAAMLTPAPTVPADSTSMELSVLLAAAPSLTLLPATVLVPPLLLAILASLSMVMPVLLAHQSTLSGSLAKMAALPSPAIILTISMELLALAAPQSLEPPATTLGPLAPTSVMRSLVLLATSSTTTIATPAAASTPPGLPAMICSLPLAANQDTTLTMAAVSTVWMPTLTL